MIHKEGTIYLIISLVLLGTIVFLAHTFSWPWFPFIVIVCSILFLLILNFFRNPVRQIPVQNNHILYAPADGKVVVIEPTQEPEFIKKDCIQISIFMNPLDVHVNRYPISGKVIYSKYHPGKYLVAWHPKASFENERTSVAILTQSGKTIMMRQIAGALARRISCYSKENDIAIQGEDMGFIKFGSRVDLFLPSDSKIKVEMNQVVRGNLDIIAEI
ncbi:MAG TPA: phosphatidylserine decarboxylase family protein [Saprospiraceae bacterium]|nr:phosphatidylserine decarboxylase family protein [Saprospiraceae bacterium]